MFNRAWWLSTGERAVKTFFQGYFTFWFLVEGLGDTAASTPGAGAFDTLFAMDNVKAGVVALALSFATSVGSTPLGVDSSSPSLTVTETAPPKAA